MIQGLQGSSSQGMGFRGRLDVKKMWKRYEIEEKSMVEYGRVRTQQDQK